MWNAADEWREKRKTDNKKREQEVEAGGGEEVLSSEIRVEDVERMANVDYRSEVTLGMTKTQRRQMQGLIIDCNGIFY